MMRQTEIKISEIQIVPVKPNNGLVAFASCVISNSFYIGNIAIYTSISSIDGYRLVYPSKVLPNGKQINCVHPINKETGKTIHKEIINKFLELTGKVHKENVDEDVNDDVLKNEQES